MGKSRRTRSRAHRSDPVKAKTKQPPTDPELAKLRESKILPALEDLKASDPKLRTSAAAAIANIIQDQKCRKLLLREQVVQTVLNETLTDASLESRAAGWEILKVLAQEEESDFCVHLYRIDILTAIDHACKSVFEALKSSNPDFTKLPKAHQRFVWEIAGSLAVLVGSLAEAQDEILLAISGNAIIARFLFTLVSTSNTPAAVLTDALACLFSLSEDNRPFSEAILNDHENSCYKTLTRLSESRGLKAVLSCGVLHSLFSCLQWQDHSPGLNGACDAVLIPALSRELVSANLDGEAVSFDVLQVTIEVLASIATSLQDTLEKGNKQQAEWNGFDDDGEDHTMELEDADSDQDMVDDNMDEDDQVKEDEGGGEVGSGGGDDDNDDDHEEEEMDEDEILADMEKVIGHDDETTGSANISDLPTLSALVEKAVPPLTRLASSSPTNDEALVVQTLALTALNNLAWTISCIEFVNGENAAIFKLWAPVGRTIWEKTVNHIISHDTADVVLAAAVTSLAWAISRSLGGKTPIRGDEHRKFISLHRASKGMAQPDLDDPFQALGVKCIGVLGQLARGPSPIPLNREIGVFLMTILNSAGGEATAATATSSAAEVVEALNQLFDIYGDEDLPCDKEVFWRDNFLSHLEQSVPKVKSVVKSIDKRKHPELRLRAAEAATNLARFIEYKKKNRRA